MASNFNLNTENKEEWLTPKWIIDELGEFDLDPCFLPPERRPWETAKKTYWKELDGLKQEWIGRVWCNPNASSCFVLYGKNNIEAMRKAKNIPGKLVLLK
jgi:hypothetical protein